MGGAKFQRGKVFLSSKNSGFQEVENPDLQRDNQYEDTDATAFDIDNDGDLDLYVTSGGNEYKELDKYYSDRVYLNDGLGNFHVLKYLYRKQMVPLCPFLILIMMAMMTYS